MSFCFARQPRQSVGGGKFLQKRAYARSPRLETIAWKGELTFGDPLLDSGSVRSTADLRDIGGLEGVEDGAGREQLLG